MKGPSRRDWIPVLVLAAALLFAIGAGTGARVQRGLQAEAQTTAQPCSEPVIQERVEFWRDRYYTALNAWRIETRRARIYGSVLDVLDRRPTLPRRPPADAPRPLWRSQR